MPAALLIFDDPELRRFALRIGGACHRRADLVRVLDKAVAARHHVFQLEPSVQVLVALGFRPHPKIADRIYSAPLEQLPIAECAVAESLDSAAGGALRQ